MNKEIEMNAERTAADFAADWDLFCEYIDPGHCLDIDNRQQFEEIPLEDRQKMAQAVIDANK